MEAWIAHQQYIRRFNWAMTVMLVIGLLIAWSVGGLHLMGTIFLVEIVAGGLFIGMANVALLLGTPAINASDEEIRTAAAIGPRWLKRLVAKLDAQS